MFYVYHLADPRNGEVFYVGKGSGDRAWQHTKDVRRGVTANPAKTARIAAILGDGALPEVRIVSKYEAEQDALDAEADYIATLPGLTNIMAGGGMAMTEAERARRDQERQTKALRRKLARTREWLRQWVASIDSWPGVTFPNIKGGDRLASEFLAEVRRMTAPEGGLA